MLLSVSWRHWQVYLSSGRKFTFFLGKKYIHATKLSRMTYFALGQRVSRVVTDWHENERDARFSLVMDATEIRFFHCAIIKCHVRYLEASFYSGPASECIYILLSSLIRLTRLLISDITRVNE